MYSTHTHTYKIIKTGCQWWPQKTTYFRWFVIILKHTHKHEWYTHTHIFHICRWCVHLHWHVMFNFKHMRSRGILDVSTCIDMHKKVFSVPCIWRNIFTIFMCRLYSMSKKGSIGGDIKQHRQRYSYYVHDLTVLE